MKLVNRFTYHVFIKFAPTFTRYDFKQFYDILFDIEVARTFISRYDQTQIYMREFNTQLNVVFVESIIVHFELKTTASIEKLAIDSFINRIDFHVMQTNISFLLCLQDMNTLRVYLNNFKNQIVLRDGFTILIVRFYKHFFLIWGLILINYLTDIELRQLHRRFEHSSVNKLVYTLKKVDYDDFDHRQML